MLKKVFRLVIRLSILASLVYLTRYAMKRWVDGPEPVPAGPDDSWAAAPGAAAPDAAPVAAPDAPRVAPPANPAPEPETGPAGEMWVGPDGTGTAPGTHPVKVKLSSGLYREPGAPNYDRTRPDRCYVSAEAAEADGFVRAKR